MALWICVFIMGLGVVMQAKEPPIVEIPDQGAVSGKEVSVSRAQKASVYLGIPFAHPPGRFEPPVYDTLPDWEGTKNSTTYEPACLQNLHALEEYERIFHAILPDQLKELTFNESCLFLNVFVPDGQPPPEKWPVIVWFHPGNFSVGATALWDGSAIAVKHKVIVVTPAYRLNIMGFFALDKKTASGNYGLLDQVAALDWVKKKISAFGGSPDDICIMGQGAGGTSVALHMLSPHSKGKFNRAIAMSGSAFSTLIKRIPSIDVYRDVIAECDEKENSDLIKCIRNLVAEGLVESTWNAYQWGPVIDNETNSFLQHDPEELLLMGKCNEVEFMTGYTDMEEALEVASKMSNPDGISSDDFSNLIREDVEGEYLTTEDANETCSINSEHIIDTLLFYYKPQPPSLEPTALRQKYTDYTTERRYGAGIYKQAMYCNTGKNIYVYRFDYKPKKSLITDLPDWVGVPHGFELPFVWGMPYWPSLPNIVWNGGDRKVADIVMNLWTNFAKFGNPIQSGLNYKWDVFKENSPGIMIIDRNFNMSDPSTFDYKALAFWTDYYPKVIEATKCCNVTQSGRITVSNPVLTGLSAIFVCLHFLLIR